jgi:Rrf2 family protein
VISKKTKYALKALTHLALGEGRGPVLIAELAQSEGIPKKFLEAILLELKNHGVLHSKKGKGGGYTLAKPADAIMLGSIIRMLDGPLAPLPCLSQTAYQRCDECRDEATCGIRLVMKEVADATAKILDHTSLADMCRQVDNAAMTFAI